PRAPGGYARLAPRRLRRTDAGRARSTARRRARGPDFTVPPALPRGPRGADERRARALPCPPARAVALGRGGTHRTAPPALPRRRPRPRPPDPHRTLRPRRHRRRTLLI